MIDLGLSHADRQRFMGALVRSHDARTVVQVLDRDENVLHDLTASVTSGSVDFDTSASIDRSCGFEMADEGQKFHFVPDGPSDFSLYADNFIRVLRGVYVNELSRWVDVPLFTGPIQSVNVNASNISVTAVGKEKCGLAPELAWNPLHIARGHDLSDAIHDIMAHQGERKFDLPKTKQKTKKPLELARTSEPWLVAKRLAKGANKQLFYDGRGKLRLRPWPKHPQFTFRSDTREATVTSRPNITYDLSRVRNTVLVRGPEPEGHQKRITYAATPPRNHPLSPQKLARHGEPRYLVEIVDGDHIHRTEQAKTMARHRLEDLLRAEMSVDFDAVPIYMLEPGDMIALGGDGVNLHMRLETFSLPLTAGEMSVGYNRRVGKKGHR